MSKLKKIIARKSGQSELTGLATIGQVYVLVEQFQLCGVSCLDWVQVGAVVGTALAFIARQVTKHKENKAAPDA